ncbi:MAG: hypothetical protein FWF66_00100, partial [Candidatus Bathyarchaeota archaeon]|nr:hypothetical protein [Candidatus Termiticorpusculum sp.]
NLFSHKVVGVLDPIFERGAYVWFLPRYLPENDQSLQAFTWVYDPVNDVWSTAKAMPACSVIAADQRTYKLVVADDLFYMIGGNNFNAQYIPIGYSPGDLVSSKLAPSLMLFAGATFASIVIVMVLVFLKRQSKNSTLDGV